MRAGELVGNGDLDVHDGLQQRGLGLLHGFAEGDAAGGLERHFVRIHVVIRAVVEDHAEIDHREAGEIAARGRFDNSLLDRGNVVLGNRAAEDLVDELEVAAARQRFHLDLAVAELAVAAALLLVASLHVGLAANGLAIRHLGRLQVDFGVIAVLQLRDDDFDVLLAGARDQEFLGLRHRGRSAAWHLLPSACGCRCSACLRRRASWARWRR